MTTNQMVSRFRVKKLSPKHPLPIYKEHELPDLADATNIQRAVPQIETGVEKEEEEEVREKNLLGGRVALRIPTLSPFDK